MSKKYKFLNQINFPSDLKKISEKDLKVVSDELREEVIDAVSTTGGHLGASLGVVELTVATVNSTTPKLAPRCPPVVETASITSSLNSSDTTFKSFSEIFFKSDGKLI